MDNKLPEILVSGRGPMMSSKLGLLLTHASPYNPTRKGIIESLFSERNLQEILKKDSEVGHDQFEDTILDSDDD